MHAQDPARYEALREQLRDLRWRAGQPSYRRMGALWRDAPRAADGSVPVIVFAPSTIADNLNGRRRAMTPDFVRFYVLSCVAHARQAGISLPDRDTHPRAWYALFLSQTPPRSQRPVTAPVRGGHGRNPAGVPSHSGMFRNNPRSDQAHLPSNEPSVRGRLTAANDVPGEGRP